MYIGHCPINSKRWICYSSVGMILYRNKNEYNIVCELFYFSWSLMTIKIVTLIIIALYNRLLSSHNIHNRDTHRHVHWFPSPICVFNPALNYIDFLLAQLIYPLNIIYGMKITFCCVSWIAITRNSLVYIFMSVLGKLNDIHARIVLLSLTICL